MVYHENTTDEENDVYKGGMGEDNPNGANWFKLRDVKNEITFKRQEIEKLRKSLVVLGASTENAKDLCE